MVGVTGTVLPVYVAVDESGSMAPQLDALNQGLQALSEALLSEPMAASKIRLSVLGFSDDVVERLHLADLRYAGAIDHMTARGGTNYFALFTDMLERIPRDIAELRAQGYRPYRPAVFLFTDGIPNGHDWY